MTAHGGLYSSRVKISMHSREEIVYRFPPARFNADGISNPSCYFQFNSIQQIQDFPAYFI